MGPHLSGTRSLTTTIALAAALGGLGIAADYDPRPVRRASPPRGGSRNSHANIPDRRAANKRARKARARNRK